MIQQGTVAKVFVNQFGTKTLYSFALQEHDGVYFSCGENNPNVETGNVVEFDVTQKGSKMYVNLPVTIKGTVSPAKSSAGKQGFKSGATSNAKDDYWTAREERDIVAQTSMRWQGAYDRALKLYELLLAAGAIKNPDTIKKLADRAPYIKGVVNQLATEIFHDTLRASGLGDGASEDNSIEVSDDDEGDEWNA